MSFSFITQKGILTEKSGIKTTLKFHDTTENTIHGFHINRLRILLLFLRATMEDIDTTNLVGKERWIEGEIYTRELHFCQSSHQPQKPDPMPQISTSGNRQQTHFKIREKEACNGEPTALQQYN